MCEMFLPPEIFLILGAHGRQHVIKVHDDVHDVVYEVGEGPMTACEKMIIIIACSPNIILSKTVILSNKWITNDNKICSSRTYHYMYVQHMFFSHY